MPDPKEPTIAASFISHLRQASRVSCTVPGCGELFPAIDDRIGDHFKSKHRDYIEGKDLNAIIRNVKRGRYVRDRSRVLVCRADTAALKGYRTLEGAPRGYQVLLMELAQVQIGDMHLLKPLLQNNPELGQAVRQGDLELALRKMLQRKIPISLEGVLSKANFGTRVIILRRRLTSRNYPLPSRPRTRQHLEEVNRQKTIVKRPGLSNNLRPAPSARSSS